MILGYDTDDGRIVYRYWGDDTPTWADNPPDGVAVVEEPDFGQDLRSELLREAKDEYEAGEDYDPETETVVARLYYDPEADDYDGGEIYGEAEIRKLPDDQS